MACMPKLTGPVHAPLSPRVLQDAFTSGRRNQQGCPLRVTLWSMTSSATRKNACSCKGDQLSADNLQLMISTRVTSSCYPQPHQLNAPSQDVCLLLLLMRALLRTRDAASLNHSGMRRLIVLQRCATHRFASQGGQHISNSHSAIELAAWDVVSEHLRALGQAEHEAIGRKSAQARNSFLPSRAISERSQAGRQAEDPQEFRPAAAERRPGIPGGERLEV